MIKYILALLLVPLFVFSNDFATDFHMRGGVPVNFLIDCRYACYQSQQHTVFANVRGGVSSTTHTYTPGSKSRFVEGNFGLGYRNTRDIGTFGIYSYYGRLKTPYHDYFSRASIGIEYFTDQFGAFLNLYTPIGKQCRRIDEKFGFNESQFTLSGHDLRFISIGKREVMSPLALELGVQKNFGKADAIIKGYYHTAYKGTKCRTGGNLELSYQLSNRAAFTLSTGYDSFYKSQAQFGMTFAFGNTTIDVTSYKQLRKLPPVYLEEFFWVQRGKEVFDDFAVKSDLFFVDNSRIYSGGFQGDGTFENPFSNGLVANTAISTVSDATLYFYQGTDQYQNFGTYNLFGTQTITGEGGNFLYQDMVILPGSDTTRPILAKNALQEMMNTPLITVTNGGSNVIENIGLANASGNVATGGSMITNVGSSINSLTVRNVTSTDKVTLFFTAGTQSVSFYNNDIYGVDLKTFNSSMLNVKADDNVFRTNRMIAQRFFQPIGASLFLESLNSSTFIVDSIKNNTCFNTTLNGNAHLGYGYLGSGTSINVTPNGFLNNISLGKLPPATAGAFLFQGVVSLVNINGCRGNFSALDAFVLQSCNINIKQVGVPANAAGLSQANNNTIVLPFSAVTITNTP